MALFSSRVPVSRQIVTHDKRRLALSLTGIAFSVLIMFTELGFYNGLNDSQAMLAPLLNGDLVVLSDKRVHLGITSKRFSPLRLSMASAVEEVRDVVPVYESFIRFRNPETRQIKNIRAIAYPPGSDPLLIPGLKQYDEALKTGRNIVFDSRSRDIYGRIETGMNIELHSTTMYRVAGLVALGPNFTNDGHIFMSANDWKELSLSDQVAMGLIRVKPGTDIVRLQQRLLSELPEDVVVMTPEQLRQREIEFTVTATPTGSIFGAGLIIGLIIGVIICYQILFNLIFDHLPQYATLKAMGFDKWFLIGIVMKQALLLSILGYVPGWLAGTLLYAAIESRTSILMTMNLERMGIILILTVIMCCLAGMLAIRNVMRTDPADLY